MGTRIWYGQGSVWLHLLAHKQLKQSSSWSLRRLDGCHLEPRITSARPVWQTPIAQQRPSSCHSCENPSRVLSRKRRQPSRWAPDLILVRFCDWDVEEWRRRAEASQSRDGRHVEFERTSRTMEMQRKMRMDRMTWEGNSFKSTIRASLSSWHVCRGKVQPQRCASRRVEPTLVPVGTQARHRNITLPCSIQGPALMPTYMSI